MRNAYKVYLEWQLLTICGALRIGHNLISSSFHYFVYALKNLNINRQFLGLLAAVKALFFSCTAMVERSGKFDET